MRQQGTIVIWIDAWGYIKPDSLGESVFVHITSIDSDLDVPPHLARVSFELAERSRPGRMAATDVRILDRSNALSDGR